VQKHAHVTKVQEAVKIANEAHPECKIEGELQTDAAIIPEVAAFKAPEVKWQEKQMF
jgi:phosphate acetyltransferase